MSAGDDERRHLRRLYPRLVEAALKSLDGRLEADEAAERATRHALEALVKALAHQLGDSLPEGVGFALFLFDHGARGSLAYAANAPRENMIRVVREWLTKIEGEPR